MDLMTATHIDVDAHVRYWEDGNVNGIAEDDDAPTMPGAHGQAWKARIELETGKVEGWPAGTEASIHYKVCDEGQYWLSDDQGERIAKWAGYYVPDDFLCHGGDGYGDYIILNVGADSELKPPHHSEGFPPGIPI